MMRFYPDTNVIHRIRTAWPPEEFEQRASRAGVVLTLGLHVVYELARGFLSPPAVRDVRAAFQYLVQLTRLEYLPPVEAVLRAEFDEAETGLPILAVLDPLNQMATKIEIARLAYGYADRAAAFIARREAAAQPVHLLISRANMKGLASVRTIKPFKVFRGKLAPAAWLALADLARLHGRRPSRASLHRIVNRPGDFPVLSTWLNAQFYLAFVAAGHRTTPSRDKRDDFRHLIESARCDVFVTCETDLVKRAQELSPFRKAASWNEFASRLT